MNETEQHLENRKRAHLMSSITLIGTGNMARNIGTLAVAGGNTVEVMGRDQSKADDLAKSAIGTSPSASTNSPAEAATRRQGGSAVSPAHVVRSAWVNACFQFEERSRGRGAPF